MCWLRLVFIIILGAVAPYAEAMTFELCWFGTSDEAIATCTRALQSGQLTREQQAGARFQRGNAYAAKNWLDQARADYDVAIRLQPDFADAYHNRGLTYSQKGELDQAIKDYNTALRLQPDAWSYNARGAAYARKGQTEAARRDFETALSLDPGNGTIMANLAALGRETRSTPTVDPSVVSPPPQSSPIRPKTDGIWGFVKDPENREVLSWIMGILVTVVSGLWVVITYFHRAGSERK